MDGDSGGGAHLEATPQAARITSLDTIRGVSVLGILTMNIVSYGLDPGAYTNLDASSPQNWLDWLIGGVGEILFDQKFMGLFSMLFGAGIVVFTDRAEAAGLRADRLAKWRNALLFLIGMVPTLLRGGGDILIIYATWSFLLISLRKQSPGTLILLGLAATSIPPGLAVLVQNTVPASGEGLGEYWGLDGPISGPVLLWLQADDFLRALGMMLIGAAAYRTGFLQGTSADDTYRKAVRWGLGLGLPLSAIGLAMVVVNDFEPEMALVGSVPNTVATIPMVFGYVGLITLWHRRTHERPLNQRVQAVGRMALTNYLSQTVLGVVILRGLFEPERTSGMAVAQGHLSSSLHPLFSDISVIMQHTAGWAPARVLVMVSARRSPLLRGLQPCRQVALGMENPPYVDHLRPRDVEHDEREPTDRPAPKLWQAQLVAVAQRADQRMPTQHPDRLLQGVDELERHLSPGLRQVVRHDLIDVA